MANGTEALAAESVVREFGDGDNAVRAVDGVSVNIAPGEFVALVGRSGSGKTTLLNLLAGLDRPSEGKVWFEGRELSGLSEKELVGLRRERIGFVFQSFGLIPLLSAFENVELPLHIGGVSWRERRRRANESLELVGLLGRSSHRPYELSGGEQQRVAIARALVAGPSVVFADEPTGELDSVTAESIGGIMREIGASRGVTVVTATHDLMLADMADRRLQMADGKITSIDD
ncbi:MAG: ABC transporter ATP-binding protein [Chloroflexota bacterium]|nr:ABC transporter ATP-binding protein [Chloroflexota bacterium]MDE2685270.1 ABC transporter ATP-binding protein [Chloroflexota bacterium]